MLSSTAVFKPRVSALTPFLYPCLDTTRSANAPTVRPAISLGKVFPPRRRPLSTTAENEVAETDGTKRDVDVSRYDHLDPKVPDYSSQPFTDSCTLTISAGAGGHGCISFLREKYIANGPPNGGDGGTGGNVYIQAVQGETSLHKIARIGTIKAGRGRNGQGSLKGGARGEDVLLSVPVGTVVREIWRHDPLAEEESRSRNLRGYGRDLEDGPDKNEADDQSRRWRRDKWLLYPGDLPKSFSSADFPALPRPRRSHLSASEPSTPILLDLDKPMNRPMLLTAGAMGGLGNPHFVTKSIPRPKFATKGEEATRIHLQLELKLLADVGLVGLPNAGKSTLLRALTRSRARVGDWAFTTLAPNVGTVVLDSHSGRPALDTKGRRKEPRTHFTIADIPGLIEDAHLDRGLGLGFLRHIERAAVLAFVVDLGAGDAVAALKALWREVNEYEKLRERELNAKTQCNKPDDDGLDTTFMPFSSLVSPSMDPEPDSSVTEYKHDIREPPRGRSLPPLSLPPISSKPWFVVATKADLQDTKDNFRQLQNYIKSVESGEDPHPSAKKNAWHKEMYVVPVSAINREGVSGIPGIVLRLLDS